MTTGSEQRAYVQLLCSTVAWYSQTGAMAARTVHRDLATGRPRSPMVSTRAPMGERTRRFSSPGVVPSPCKAFLSPVLGSPTAQRRQGKFVALPDRRTGHAIRFPCMDVLESWSLEFQRPAGVSGKFLFTETLASERLVGMALLS